MTSRADRRHRLQQYPIPLVRRAIADTVYGEENQRMVTDLYINNLSDQDAAHNVPISVRGLYKRLDSIVPPMENYLKKLN